MEGSPGLGALLVTVTDGTRLEPASLERPTAWAQMGGRSLGLTGHCGHRCPIPVSTGTQCFGGEAGKARHQDWAWHNYKI